jgi:hypothetical protein
MITDIPSHKAKQAGFLESDRIRTLDLPQDRSLLTITKSVESAMAAGRSRDVRAACTEFLKAASMFYKGPACSVRVLAARQLRDARELVERIFWRLHTGDHGDPRVDEDSRAKGDHVLRKHS